MRTIVVGTDFSEGSYLALELAIDVANRMRCTIMLVWVRREKVLFTGEQMEMMTNLAQDKLRDLCERHRPALTGGSIDWRVVNGKVPSAIASVAKLLRATMIVIGTNGASGFEKFVIGSQASRIVQEAPCPVLTIRKGYNFHKQLERIVVPIRVNTRSREKVPPAATMARIFGSKVYLLGLRDLKEEEATLRTYLTQSINLLEREGVAYHVDLRPYSSYSETVLSYADGLKADLVVINTEQDAIISQFFLGTNAQQIVHKSQIPVLCIHPEDFVNVAAKI